MDRSFRRIIAYITYPIIIFFIVMGLGMLAAPPVYQYAEAKIRMAVQKGAPKVVTVLPDTMDLEE